jgi:cell division protein FtsN
MRITCPKCQFKGLIDTAPLAFETQVACVRCGTTFDALLIEGEIQTILLPNDEEELHAQETAPDATAQVMQPNNLDAEDVLALPQTPDAGNQSWERVPLFEDVLVVSPADAELVEQENPFARQAEERAEEEPASLIEDFAKQTPDESEFTEMGGVAEETSFKFGQALEVPPPGAERHNTGMRLMRISPLWLLLCGMTFISVIVLSNQFAKPAEQEQRIAASYAAPGNKATNQALPEPPLPASVNPAATASQDVSQVAAPAPVELKNEKEASAEKAEAEDKDEPEAAPAPKAAPVVETKSDAVVPAVQSEGEKSGGLTIQIGSYNVIEQANERLASLRAAGFDARVVAVELPKRGTWYRVHAGRFNNREEAARYGNEMKAKGAADNFIVTDAQGGK